MKRSRRTSARGRAATALAAVLAVAICVAVPARAQAPQNLLPDLQVGVPDHVTLHVHDGRVFVGFDASMINSGKGPLEIEGTRPDRSTAGMVARQLVSRTDGSMISARSVGTLRWVSEPNHRYWHLDDVMRYEIRRADSYAVVRSGSRRGYCLRDRSSFPRGCGRGLPHLLSLIEGIAPAKTSRWAPISEGQSFDITRLPSGRYWLVQRANPDGRFLEVTDDNNATSVLMDFTNERNGRLRRLRLRLIGSCPGAERCTQLKSFAR